MHIQKPGATAALNGTNITTAQGNISTNASSIQTNENDIATNAAAIAGLSGGGGFNGTADRALVTNGSGDVAVSEVTSAQLEYSKNVTSDLQTQLDNRLTLDSVNAISSGQLKLASNANQSIILQHDAYDTLKLYSNYGEAGMQFGARGSMVISSGGRFSFTGGCKLLQMPVVTAFDTSNAAHSCLCVKDNKLYFNSAGTWKEVTLSS